LAGEDSIRVGKRAIPSTANGLTSLCVPDLDVMTIERPTCKEFPIRPANIHLIARTKVGSLVIS